MTILIIALIFTIAIGIAAYMVPMIVASALVMLSAFATLILLACVVAMALDPNIGRWR